VAVGGGWSAGASAPVVAMLGALGIVGQQGSSCESEDKGLAALLKEADAMYDSGNKIGVLKLLEGKYADKPEVLWRLARAYYDSAEVRPSRHPLTPHCGPPGAKNCVPTSCFSVSSMP
jgi:hypothetical protein